MNISESAPQNAKAYLNKGYNCAEATLLSLVEDNAPLDLIKVSTPFGGGLGATRGVCGIVTGGSMAIGYYFGRSNPDDLDIKKLNYKLTRQFLDYIRNNYKMDCRDIVITDDFKGHTEVCLNMIEDAVSFLRNLILTNKK